MAVSEEGSHLFHRPEEAEQAGITGKNENARQPAILQAGGRVTGK
jgi:hypothetical protein